MKDSFVRVAAATPEIKVADPMYNADLIIKLIKDASFNQAAAIVFPEPDLSAYALKSEIPDVSNFATTEFVQTKYDEILNSIPEAPSYDEIICDGGEI
jgi:predicted amidohydrolase